MSTARGLSGGGPEPRPPAPGRRRRGLLVAILLGTVLVAVAAVVALPLIKGTAGEQASEASSVFLAALQQGDDGTAYGLLCADERARLQPGQVAGEYLRPGTPTIGDATDADLGNVPAQRVAVRWTDGD